MRDVQMYIAASISTLRNHNSPCHRCSSKRCLPATLSIPNASLVLHPLRVIPTCSATLQPPDARRLSVPRLRRWLAQMLPGTFIPKLACSKVLELLLYEPWADVPETSEWRGCQAGRDLLDCLQKVRAAGVIPTAMARIGVSVCRAVSAMCLLAGDASADGSVGASSTGQVQPQAADQLHGSVKQGVIVGLDGESAGQGLHASQAPDQQRLDEARQRMAAIQQYAGKLVEGAERLVVLSARVAVERPAGGTREGSPVAEEWFTGVLRALKPAWRAAHNACTVGPGGSGEGDQQAEASLTHSTSDRNAGASSSDASSGSDSDSDSSWESTNRHLRSLTWQKKYALLRQRDWALLRQELAGGWERCGNTQALLACSSMGCCNVPQGGALHSCIPCPACRQVVFCSVVCMEEALQQGWHVCSQLQVSRVEAGAGSGGREGASSLALQLEEVAGRHLQQAVSSGSSTGIQTAQLPAQLAEPRRTN